MDKDERRKGEGRTGGRIRSRNQWREINEGRKKVDREDTKKEGRKGER